MFMYKGDISKLNSSNLIPKSLNVEKLAREIAFDALALVSDRIQQRGEKSDGSKITSPAKTKFGAYSKGYGVKRKKAGRETDYIDLTFSGDMMGDFIVSPVNGGAEVGFKGKESSDKADWNEAKFGTIFHLSEDETQQLNDIVQSRINEILNK